MTIHRVYIFGASGSGTSTIGTELARKLSLPHIDCDDHYWAPVDPPFSQKRSNAERLISMKTAAGDRGWVISGSCHGWGAEVIETATLLVFVALDTPTRLHRLLRRETARFGGRIMPGGDMHKIHKGFLAWASEYDNPQFAGRNRAKHETWLKEQVTQQCRIDGSQPVLSSVAQIMAHLTQK